ncbi:MAG: GNAT family N-acetyltransferase [Actinobacteria bacterium]|nr:GNAT family N-acetyltransferase [Actinomycetota bacterium]
MAGLVTDGMSSGWATDLAILELAGSTIEDHDDHVVVRSARHPDYHWGNCILVSGQDAVEQPERWLDVFRAAFPDAGWVAIGLDRMPMDAGAWTARDLELEVDEVLTTREAPRLSPLPESYTARRLSGDDWEQYVARGLRENARAGTYEPSEYERFFRARAGEQREMSDRGVAAFFGAFLEGVLVAELGIVRCGHRARFQDVGTDEAHRRRGLAAHLLGVAAGWAEAEGCDEWVIVTASDNAAGRVYRRAGFTPDSGVVQAYRFPAR